MVKKEKKTASEKEKLLTNNKKVPQIEVLFCCRSLAKCHTKRSCSIRVECCFLLRNLRRIHK